MRRYDSYKDSGQQWIGEIPSHWRLRKMKFSFTERTSKGFPNESLLSATQSHGVIPQSMYENRTVQATKNLETLKLVEKGDFVISLRSFQGGIEYAYYRGIISPAYTILFPYAIDSGFFKHLGKSQVFIDLLQSTVTGIREGQNIDYSKLKQTYLPIPPKEEQQAISHYIDRIAADIDKAITQQQRMIDLLNERRQIIIQQAVTKGLNPNVKMKDSDVEWIGQVPEHWEVMKTSHIYSNIGSGTTPSSSNSMYYTEDTDGFYWLQTGDLNDGQIWNTSKKVTKLAVKECKLKFYPVNSVVIAMYGATIGKVGLLKIETATNQACCVLPKSRKMKELFSFYLYQAAKQPMILEAMGGGQPNISQDIIKRLKVPVPPLSEQQQIIDHIEKQIACIDKAIAKQQQTIDLLKERKQIVINDAVTGKIKVI